MHDSIRPIPLTVALGLKSHLNTARPYDDKKTRALISVKVALPCSGLVMMNVFSDVTTMSSNACQTRALVSPGCACVK